jgi:hypothetical protein
MKVRKERRIVGRWRGGRGVVEEADKRWERAYHQDVKRQVRILAQY